MTDICYYVITNRYIEFSGEDRLHLNTEIKYEKTIEEAIKSASYLLVNNAGQYEEYASEAYFCKSNELKILQKNYSSLFENIKTLGELYKFADELIDDCLSAIRAHEYYSFSYNNMDLSGTPGPISIEIKKQSFDLDLGLPVTE